MARQNESNVQWLLAHTELSWWWCPRRP